MLREHPASALSSQELQFLSPVTRPVAVGPRAKLRVPVEHGLRREERRFSFISVLKIGSCAYLDYTQVDTGLSWLI